MNDITERMITACMELRRLTATRYASCSMHLSASNYGGKEHIDTDFYFYVNPATGPINSSGKSPEEAVAQLVKRLSPEAKLTRATQLRALADQLEAEASKMPQDETKGLTV